MTGGTARWAISPEGIVRRLFERAGIEIGGRADHDITVHDDRFYGRVLRDGSLGYGESYMDGWWDTPALDVHIHRMVASMRSQTLPPQWRAFVDRASWVWRQQQTLRGARRHVQAHYDLGNDFYRAMLGRTMTYSCGYWRHADDLDTAQDHKHALICAKLGLKPEHRVLDIGCGWGGFARFAAEHVGCHVTGITLSEPQARYARAACEGLPVQIDVRDYRALDPSDDGHFDRVVSVGMFEHVGRAYYPTFMETVRRMLPGHGLALLHTIGRHKSRATEPWINRYIFPGGMLPSASDITQAADELLVIEDWHDFRADYDRTLMAWHRNCLTAGADGLKQRGERFTRMWTFYLCAFAANFRAGDRHQLWQVVLSPHGVEGGYRSVRALTDDWGMIDDR